MKINFVSIAGPDNNTDIDELVSISKIFPFVEWGILFSAKAPQKRFPDNTWVAKLITYKELKLSAHLCGRYSREIMQDKNFEAVNFLSKYFKRIQLNFNFKTTDHNLSYLHQLIVSFPDTKFILQLNKSNQSTIERIIESAYTNLHILFDASGGWGKELISIQNPITNYFTGYAGGINCNNIDKICQMILDNESKDVVYIDLESGIRTNNDFDCLKVKELLSKASKFISNEQPRAEKLFEVYRSAF